MAPSIDRKRLLRDARKGEKKRPLPSVGRETVGIVRAVRELLPTIRELRAEGVRWAVITEALNGQGIYPPGPDGQAILLTTNRLTAMVSDLERREANKDKRAGIRSTRPGLVQPNVSKTSPKTVTLSPELQRPAKTPDDIPPVFDTEEDIRLRHLAGIQHLLKD